MLIYAKFKNLLSFDGDGVEFSMVASETIRKNASHVVQVSDARALKDALVIGPNASGKSNIVKAFHLLKQMVGEGNCGRARGKQSLPCAKGEKIKSAPSTWDIVYSWGDMIFQYVLTTNGIKVHKESLSILGKGDKETEIFVRNGQRVKYGAHFKASDYRSIKVFPYELLLGKVLKEGVFKEDANVQNGHFLDAALKGLDAIHINPFESGTDNRVMLPKGVDPVEFAEFLEEFFRSLDVGVDGIQVEKKECRYDYMPTGLDPDRWLLCNWGGWLMAFQGPVEKAHVASFRFRCHGVEMTLDQMGNGVKRILPIAEACFLMKLTSEETWVFDDFGDGLHPHLTKHLVKVIQNLMSKKKHQVILTTHDTSLLDDYLWRSDEVWFCEKRLSGATDLFALCEFKGHEGRWDWQQDYLVGRFEAIPRLGSILLGEED